MRSSLLLRGLFWETCLEAYVGTAVMVARTAMISKERYDPCLAGEQVDRPVGRVFVIPEGCHWPQGVVVDRCCMSCSNTIDVAMGSQMGSCLLSRLRTMPSSTMNPSLAVAGKQEDRARLDGEQGERRRADEPRI